MLVDRSRKAAAGGVLRRGGGGKRRGSLDGSIDIQSTLQTFGLGIGFDVHKVSVVCCAVLCCVLCRAEQSGVVHSMAHPHVRCCVVCGGLQYISEQYKESSVSHAEEHKIELELRRNVTSDALKAYVTENYQKFIATSKEIASIETEMLKLNHMLNDFKTSLKSLQEVTFSYTDEHTRALREREEFEEAQAKSVGYCCAVTAFAVWLSLTGDGVMMNSRWVT